MTLENVKVGDLLVVEMTHSLPFELRPVTKITSRSVATTGGHKFNFNGTKTALYGWVKSARPATQADIDADRVRGKRSKLKGLADRIQRKALNLTEGQLDALIAKLERFKP